MDTGKLIVFEGGEGAGKSTCLKALSTYLTGKGHTHITTDMLGREGIGAITREKMLRSNPPCSMSAQLFYVAAADLEVMSEIVMPALKAGKTVVMDRFIATYYVYQVLQHPFFNNENEIGDVSEVFKVLKNIFNRLKEPDIFFYCDVSPEVARDRAHNRGKFVDNHDSNPISWYQDVYDGYEHYMKYCLTDKTKIVRINTEEHLEECIIKMVKTIESI